MSGHLAPAEFFNPVTFAVLALPYGCGALLCREFARRWRTGWPGLLLLGVAYAIYEEGIVSRALFTPAWHEEPQLVGVDHAFGVNWSLGVMLVHFHAAISIAASIIIAEIVYPARRADPWLRNTYVAICAGVLMAWAPVLARLARSERPLYAPPPLHWLIAGVAIAGCIAGARYFRFTPRPAGLNVPAPRWFFAAGFANMAVMLGVVFVLPEHSVHIPLPLLVPALVVFDVATLWLLVRWSVHGMTWDDRHRLALVAGWLAPFLVLGILGDFEQFRAQSVVSVAAIAGLVRLRYVVRGRPASA